MATAEAKALDCKLVSVGTVNLEEADLDPWYTSFVVLSGGMVIVIDGWVSNVRLHRIQDGQILARSDKLLSRPYDACICVVQENDIQLAVCLVKGQIEILSVKSTGHTASITRVRTFDVKRGFDKCYAVKHFKENLLVSGRKVDNLCWGIVSLKDGHVGTIHDICKRGKYGGVSYLATNPTDDNMFYISCNAASDSPDNTGVYGYDITRSTRWEFLYQHSDLKNPKGISVNARGFIYVCNWNNPPCIHQLTQRGEPVAIHRDLGVPSGIYALYWEEQQGELYVTSTGSNVVRRFRPLYTDQHDPVIPAEVLKMDTRSVQMYKEALRDGKEKVYNIKVMVVGQYGVGKTTLTKRLLGEDVNISDRKSTEGIDIHIECCKVSLATGEWQTQEKNAEQYSRLQRLVKLLNECVKKQEDQSWMDDLFADKEHDNGHCVDTSIPQTINQPVQCRTSMKKSSLLPRTQPTQLSFVNVDERSLEHGNEKTSNVAIPGSEENSDKSEKKDAVLEILHLVNKNADKLEKSVVEYASLAMWDFAGQYVFYTTHQTFLTSHAIYLLVIDLNQEVTDLIKDDEYFLDTEGIIQCKVHDLIEVWLNSIHFCTPSPKSGIPPVILVGTHADKIPEKSRQNVIDEYYKKIRHLLKDKPTILHLKDDIAIDNTKCDPKLEELKIRIFELASQQPHWGEEKPARWLPLEQSIMTLKASGVKVVPLSLVEEINRSGSVRIEDRDELDLFLRFQHETGTILYFNVEGLREKIVLDPQWLIDALKSLITAEMFIRKNPAITSKWFEFSEKGKLTQELIDAIWTKEKNPELHDNKEHILLLMEKLNIIARPRSYSEDRKEIKEEDYYLAPCMLRQATPKQMISPESCQIESTSVLCFVSTGKFIPPPVFHRLVGACLTRWPIAKQKSENLIYCGCCVFDLDFNHRLTVHCKDCVIFAQVTGIGVTDMGWSSERCSEARQFIFENLSKIIGNQCESLQFELHVQCPDSDADSLEGLIAVPLLQKNEKVICHSHAKSHLLVSRELLQFWFEDRGSPIEDEEDSVSSLEDEKLSERQLGRLSLKIGREFPRLGLELELAEANIQQIQDDYPDAATACLMILVKWKQRNEDKATFRNLEEAFKVVGIDVGILKSVDTTGDRVSCLPQKMLDKQPEDRHLNQISNGIGKEYVHLGVELGVAVSRIEQIRIKHPRDMLSQCLEIMRQWRQDEAQQATFRTLEQAFRCVGIDPSILKLCVK